MEQGRRNARGLVMLALVVAGCGSPGNGAGGTGGGPGVDGGTGGAPTSSIKACPSPVEHGAACAADTTPLCPISTCQSCIGGMWRLFPSPVLSCVCRNGAWACPGGAGGLPSSASSTIVDCVVDVPLSCAEAQTVYTSATCTEHPACTP